MSESNVLAKPQETGMARVKNYMLSPEVKERFTEMMGPNGIYYLNQVLILVANSTDLQKCDPKSILISAMRAASLKLSVDPSSGQAWIIPYKGVATFQLGYKGVYELALRTNLYRFINVVTIYEGEKVTENRMTGIHAIEGRRTGDPVIGYMLYFQLLSGFEKTFYMTLEEIEAHARHYSPGYKNPRSKWHDPVERPKMEKKTVLVNGLRRWGRFNQGDKEIIDAIEDEQGRWIVADDMLPEEGEVTGQPVEKRSEGQILSELYGPPVPVSATYTREDAESELAEGEVFEDVEDPISQLPPLRLQPEGLRKALTDKAAKLTGQASNGKRGVVVTVLEEILSSTTNPTESRHMLLKYLTGHDSTKDIPDGMILALYAWLNPQKDSGGAWIADSMAAREAVAAFNAAQPDQAELF